MRRIQSGQEEDQSEVENALGAIQYRMDQMSVADYYLGIMGIRWVTVLQVQHPQSDAQSFLREARYH